MARVEPGQNFLTGTNNRYIIASNKDGDLYYYRNSIQHLDVDPRVKGSEYEKYAEALAIAPKIYKNKPECWKDHFKRAWREITFGHGMDKQYKKRITGYDLAIQQLLETIKSGKGHYYDPPCWCILTKDPLGEPPHTKTNFSYEYSRKVHYKYNETKTPDVYFGCFYAGRDPFRSSGWGVAPTDKKLFLANSWSIPRVCNSPQGHWDWKDWENPIMWPPIRIVEPGQAWYTGTGLWDCCSFEYTVKGPCECDPQGNMLKCITAYYIHPNVNQSLCGRENAKLNIKYSEYGMTVEMVSSGGPPFKELYFEDKYLGTFGCGTGGGVTVGGGGGFPDPSTNTFQPMGMFDKMEPCPMGKRKCNRPWGKEIPADIIQYNQITPCDDGSGTTTHQYILELPETIRASYSNATPEFCITVNGPFYDSRGYQNWWPWGGVRIAISNDDINYTPVHIAIVAFGCNPNQQTYCFTNEVAKMNFKFVKISIRNTTVWKCCTKTTLYSLRLLDRLQEGYPGD